MAVDPIIGGAIVTGASQGAQSLINAARSKKNIKRTFDNQVKLNNSQFSHNVDMWNRANEYNTPTNQMSRLEEAGLNPNMVYGTGTVAGNTSTETPKYQAFNPEFNQQPFEIPNLMQILSQYQDMRIKSAQVDNLAAQNDNIKQDTINKQMGELGTWSKSGKAYHELEDYKKYGTTNAKYSLEHKKLDTERIRYDNQLRELGMQPTDSLPVRILGRVLQKYLKVGSGNDFMKYFKF